METEEIKRTNRKEKIVDSMYKKSKDWLEEKDQFLGTKYIYTLCTHVGSGFVYITAGIAITFYRRTKIQYVFHNI